MRTAYQIIFSAILLSTTACSTLNESMQLGATLGAVSGAAATYSANRSVDKTSSFEEVANGAANPELATLLSVLAALGLKLRISTDEAS